MAEGNGRRFWWVGPALMILIAALGFAAQWGVSKTTIELVREDLRAVKNKVDNHETRLSRLEGRAGGGGS